MELRFTFALLTKLVWSRRLDIGQVLYCVFYRARRKEIFFLAGKRREVMGPFCSPLTGSQSERRIRFNLLARGFSHMINATQGFIWKEIAWPPGLLERKNNNKVVSFSTLLMMFTVTWITEKERGRRIS